MILIAAGIDKFFKLFQLFVCHLVGKLRTDAEFKRLIDMLQHSLFLLFGQCTEPELF